jgi:SP family general alpha glucoside:H+ symporter-like MFS transporter
LSRCAAYLLRIPFAVQWIWPIPIIFVCLFCPESPTWRKLLTRFHVTKAHILQVVEKGREAEAEAAVRRLQSDNTSLNIATPQETVALLAQTNAFEKRLTEGVGYVECFKGTNLRRTEIAVGTWVVQQMCGPVLQTYAIYFFEQAGMSSAQAFHMSLGLVSYLHNVSS